MKIENNIGDWNAVVEIDGKTAQIIVNGTFPTDGQKPGYRLMKNEPQGLIESELLLTLVFGGLVVRRGKVNFSSSYREPISDSSKYNTVLVVDDNGRTLANINVVI